MLLYYGADIEPKDIKHDTVFDEAVKEERFEIQEILFDYFFDPYSDYELKLTHLVHMIMKKPPFLERLIKPDFDVELDNGCIIAEIFFFDREKLLFFVENFSWVLEKIFSNYHFYDVALSFASKMDNFSQTVTETENANKLFHQNLEILLTSDLRDDTANFFENIHSITEKLDSLVSQKYIDSLVRRLLSYGMDLYEVVLHII